MDTVGLLYAHAAMKRTYFDSADPDSFEAFTDTVPLGKIVESIDNLNSYFVSSVILTPTYNLSVVLFPIGNTIL